MTENNLVQSPSLALENVINLGGAQSSEDYIFLWLPDSPDYLIGAMPSTVVIPGDWVINDERVPGIITQEWLDQIEADMAAAAAAAGTIAGVISQPIDINPIIRQRSGITTLFPFSIPFSLAAAIGSLQRTPQAPRFEADFYGTVFDGWVFTLDFNEFETIAVIIRWAVWLSFFVGLMLLTNKVIRW